MVKNGDSVKERVVFGSIGLILLFGFGIVVGRVGFRWSDLLGPQFLGFSIQQWDGAFSGLMGAVAGGAVAILVLEKTLTTQRELAQDQSVQSARQHGEQLEAQRTAANDTRVMDSVANGTAYIVNFVPTLRADSAGSYELARKLFVTGMVIRFDARHGVLGAALTSIAVELMEIVDRYSKTPLEQITEVNVVLATAQVYLIAWFQESVSRDLAANELTDCVKGLERLRESLWPEG